MNELNATTLFWRFQLNSRRLRERRPAENVVSLQMPYDAEKFNFTKVKPDEILFLMEPERDGGHLLNGFTGKAEKEDDFTADLHEKVLHLTFIY